MLMSSSSRQRKVISLTVLAVASLRPRETSSTYAKLPLIIS